MSHIPGSPPPCSICGTARSVHEAVKGAICSSRDCQTAEIRQRESAARAEFEAECDRISADFAESTGVDDAITARVPYMDREVVETPAVEIQMFRDALRAAFRETFRRARSGNPVLPIPEDDTPASDVLNASCIACRGYCCRQGAGHAFLKPEYLPTVMARRPKESPAALYRDYIRNFPVKSMKDACLYQGEQGCVLPREKRSWVCNDFECRDRIAMKIALHDKPDASAIVVAMDEGKVRAAVVARPDAALEWVDT